MRCRILSIATVAALLTGAAPVSADVVVDFDDGTNPFSGGAISTDQAFSGPNSLFLDMGDTAVYTVPTELVAAR